MTDEGHVTQPDPKPAARIVSALMIDDNAFDRRRLVRVAGETCLDFLIQEVGDVEAFGRALDSEKFDVVYVDLNLAGASGMNLLPAVRNHRVNRDAAMIMVAGDGQAEVALEAVRAGFADYIEKDKLNASALERATLNALEKRKLTNRADEAAAETRSIEGVLNSFARACTTEMRPMLTRMVRQVRQLRSEQVMSEQGCASIGQIEQTCARMDEFLQDLGSLANEGQLSTILGKKPPLEPVQKLPDRTPPKVQPEKPTRPAPASQRRVSAFQRLSP